MDAWIYARKSPSDTDEQVGVDSQKKLCLTEIERRGWRHAGTFEDVAKSAFEAQFRPGYEALLVAIKAGQVGAVVVRHNDRLHRDVEEYKQFVRLVRKHGVQVVAVLGGDWTVDTAAGRFTGTMLAAFGELESAIKSERILSGALLRRAEAGLPAHTRFRPFGFEADGMTVRKDEADALRTGVADLIAGRRSLTAVAKSWGKTTTGARRILQSRRLVGQREFQGVVYEAAWPAVIGRDDWEVVQAILSGKKRPAYARRHLLSGLARCGSCGSLLKVGTVRGAVTYRCMARSDGVEQPTCPKKVQRQADRLEAYVVGKLLRALEEGERGPVSAGDAAAAVAEIRTLEKRLAEIEAQLEGDDAPVAMLSRAYRRVETRIGQLRADVTLTPVAGSLGPPEKGWRRVKSPWHTWWDDVATPAEQRALLAEHVETIHVFPTQHGRLPLDKSAVRIEWREAGAQ